MLRLMLNEPEMNKQERMAACVFTRFWRRSSTDSVRGLNELDGFQSVSFPYKSAPLPFSIDPPFLEDRTDQ